MSSMNKFIQKLEKKVHKVTHRNEETPTSSPGSMESLKDLRQPGYGQMAEADAPAKGPALGVSGPAKLGMPKDTALQTGGTNTFEPLGTGVQATSDEHAKTARTEVAPELAKTNLPDVDHPKAVGYAPLSEDFAAPPRSEGPSTTTSSPLTSSLYSSTTTGTKAFGETKPSITDVGFGQKQEEQKEPLLKTFEESREAKDFSGKLGQGSGMTEHSMGTTLPTLGDDKAMEGSENEPSTDTTMPLPGDEKVMEGGTTDLSMGTTKGDDKLRDLSAADAGATRQDKNVGGTVSDASSKRSDYTSALDKLAPSETASSKGTFGSVQEFASSTAQAAADQAQRLKDAAAQSVNSSGASTGDVQGSAKSTVQVIKEKAQQAAQSAHEAVRPYLDAAADKTGQTYQSTREAVQPHLDYANEKAGQGKQSVQDNFAAAADKAGVENKESKSTLQQAQEIVTATAAAAAEKAQQAIQVVQQKVQESNIPQRLADHTAAARDTAQSKVQDLSAQAQVHQRNIQNVAAQHLSAAQAQAQETARVGQQKAAELARNVQNASAEDVNRSWLGRALGAILLLWLASVSLGLPFKYGLAAALLAISAALFLDWDRARRSGGRSAASSHVSSALAPKVIHVRHEEQTPHTEFGDIKVAAGHIEKPVGGVMEARFVEKATPVMPATVEKPVPVMPVAIGRPTVIATKPAAMSHPFIKEE